MHVFRNPKGRFGLELDAGRNLDSLWAQVVKKFGKRRKNEGPRLLFGALWAPIDRLGRV